MKRRWIAVAAALLAAASAVLLGTLPARAAPCEPDRRQLIGGLKCDDPVAETWYQLEVYGGCQQPRGRPAEPVLEIKERRPDLHESRRTLSAGRLAGFLLDRLGKGERFPVLFVAALPGGRAVAEEVCTQQTRQTLTALRCNDAKGRALGIDVEVMCHRSFGVPQTQISLIETGGNKPKVRKKLDPQQATALSYQNLGVPQATIFRQAHKGTVVEAIALLKPDGGLFDWIKLRIAPAGAAECNRAVDMRPAWAAHWEPPPRRGYIEAVAIPNRDVSAIDAVTLTIVPVAAASPACERSLDVSELWTKRWD